MHSGPGNHLVSRTKLNMNYDDICCRFGYVSGARQWVIFEAMDYLSGNRLSYRQWIIFQAMATISGNGLSIRQWIIYYTMGYLSSNGVSVFQAMDYRLGNRLSFRH